jgi:hypothetical protein
MTTPATKVLGSIKPLPLHWKLAIGLAAALLCWGALVLTTHLVNRFNSSMGVTKSQTR